MHVLKTAAEASRWRSLSGTAAVIWLNSCVLACTDGYLRPCCHAVHRCRIRFCADEEDICDPSRETETTKIAIKWEERPRDCEDFFKDKDIDLEFLWDWPNDWSVYEAEDVETANAIMTDIVRILDGASEHFVTTTAELLCPAAVSTAVNCTFFCWS